MIIILDSISSQFTLDGGHIVYYINHEKKLAPTNRIEKMCQALYF